MSDYGITECVDGYYCNTCGRHTHDHPKKCEPPISEVDICWSVAVLTLREAAKMYAESKTNKRLFTYNPEYIGRMADKIERFHSECHQRWQLVSMRDRMDRTY
jgi:hypothetical protein